VIIFLALCKLLTGPRSQVTRGEVPSHQPNPPLTTSRTADSGRGVARTTKGVVGEERDSLETQVHQVTSVLPQVPHTVIRADLSESSVEEMVKGLARIRFSKN